jgi:hypothetical protein
MHRICAVSIVFSLAACQATEECEEPEPEPADVSTSDVDTSGACTALCAAERRVAEPLGCEVPPTGVCLEACADIPDRCATAHVRLLHCSIRSVGMRGQPGGVPGVSRRRLRKARRRP